MTTATLKPKFFQSPSAFRKWLAANHTSSKELWVGFYKKGSGKPSITWPARNKTAWEFFQAQPPSYRKLMNWRVISAKKEETRMKRLKQLIELSTRKQRMRTM